MDLTSMTTLASLRKAAALAFAVPGLEVDLRLDADLAVRVHRRREHSHMSPATTVLCPGAFRVAVGHLLADAHRAPAPLLGLQTAGLRVQLVMPFSGAARPLGMVVVRIGKTIVHLFATTRSPAEAMSVIAEVGCHPSISVSINAAWDDTTQITLAYAESRISEVPLARPHIEAMMEAAFVRLGVEEITSAVAAATASSSAPPE